MRGISVNYGNEIIHGVVLDLLIALNFQGNCVFFLNCVCEYLDFAKSLLFLCF